MPSPNFILLYVSSVPTSTAFYADLLEAAPVEASPTFAMFALPQGMMLGLWGVDGVQPAASLPPAGGELAFAQAADAEVEALHNTWKNKGLTILQAPTVMDFGYTFVAADPDGHRLRVFAPR